MLKIMIHEIPAEQRWVLSGNLTEPWASELTAKWESARGSRAAKKCVVDLIDVIFVDGSGKKVLSQMIAEGAEFMTDGLYTQYVIESLKGRRRNRTGGPNDAP